MRTNMDIWADAGVVALDQDELLTVRGGLPQFIVAVGAGLIVGLVLEVWDSWDEFKEGFRKGYEWWGIEGG